MAGGADRKHDILPCRSRGFDEGTTAALESHVRSVPTDGPVAQLGARLNGIQEVTGSIPVRSTTLSFRRPNLPQVAESRRGCRGSNKPLAVERHSLREEQLLEPLALVRAEPAPRDRRRAAEPVLRTPGCPPRRVHRVRWSARSIRASVSSSRSLSRRAGRTSRCRSSARTGRLRPDGRASAGSPSPSARLAPASRADRTPCAPSRSRSTDSFSSRM